MAIAYALNSVKFDPATAGRCNDAGEWVGSWRGKPKTALGHDTFDFGDDMNHAHVQPNGAYHYHGMPELLIDFLGDNNGMTLIGGHLMAFLFMQGMATLTLKISQSQLKALSTSYRLKSQPDENRPNTLTAQFMDQTQIVISVNLFQWVHLRKTMNMLRGLVI